MSAGRIVRNRVEAVTDALDRSQRPGAYGSAAQLMITTTVTTYPTAAGAYYAVLPAWLVGVEVEGGADMPVPVPGVTTPGYALNVGSMVPPVGTPLLVESVGNRSVFRYDG